MSSSSASQHAVLSALSFLPVSDKLTHGNFPLWHAQVISSIRGAEVFEFLNPKAKPPNKYLPKKNPDDVSEEAVLNKEYTAWVAKDQQVLSYLLVSLSREILQQVSDATTATEAWADIEAFFCLSISRSADDHQNGSCNRVQGYIHHRRVLRQDEGAC
jgi:hypothetical protein